MKMTSRIFQARNAELDEMMAWVRNLLTTTPLAGPAAKKFEIALEEALINIIQHAYPHLSGLIEMTYKFDSATGEIHITLSDQGIPFNPLNQQHKPDLTSDLSERQMGGLGIHFMLKMTDRISYRREGDSNILTLIKSVN